MPSPLTQTPDQSPHQAARKARKRALPRSLRKLHDGLRPLPLGQALDLLADATAALASPEARILALRLRLRLIADALAEVPSAQPKKPKPQRKSAKPTPPPKPEPEPEVLAPPPPPPPAPRPRAATLNTLDPSDPAIFGLLNALSDPDEDTPPPAPKAKPAPASDPFALLAELDSSKPDTSSLDAMFGEWDSFEDDAEAQAPDKG